MNPHLKCEMWGTQVSVSREVRCGPPAIEAYHEYKSGNGFDGKKLGKAALRGAVGGAITGATLGVLTAPTVLTTALGGTTTIATSGAATTVAAGAIGGVAGGVAERTTEGKEPTPGEVVRDATVGAITEGVNLGVSSAVGHYSGDAVAGAEKKLARARAPKVIAKQSRRLEAAREQLGQKQEAAKAASTAVIVTLDKSRQKQH